jgi:uncharacterized protein
VEASGVGEVARYAVAGAAAVLAGAVNAVAGGGTLISFPTLLFLGVGPVVANATNAVALWPGNAAGAVGFRNELAHTRRWLVLLLPPSIVGGLIGAVILLHTGAALFRTIAPFLILLATGLLAAQGSITSRMSHMNPNTSAAFRWSAIGFQFMVGIYGGFFGAGIGILMLAALGLLGVGDIHQMNGLKNVLAVCINGIAAVYFVVSGAVVWSFALVMAAGAIAGGFTGASVARHLSEAVVRRFVIVIGISVAVILLVTR